jgi:hypothetical protein
MDTKNTADYQDLMEALAQIDATNIKCKEVKLDKLVIAEQCDDLIVVDLYCVATFDSPRGGITGKFVANIPISIEDLTELINDRDTTIFELMNVALAFYADCYK